VTIRNFTAEPSDLTTAIVTKTSEVLERRASRRGFLVRLTILGSALTLGPIRYLLYPESALAACSGCANPCPGACGNSCSCGSTCCSSANSTFCCTLTGSNTCPGGSTLCGSWSCGNTGLVMADCCDTSCGSCRCANGACGNRRACCFPRLYNNCGQDPGRIFCRITRNRNSCYGCSTAPREPVCTSVPACAANPPC
jgi:hypothetical protein